MYVKKLFFVLCLLLLSSSIFAQVLGDANGDNTINIIDALITAKYVVGLQPTPFFPAAADVFGCDGTVDLIDALMIAKYAVGLINSFPCSGGASFTVTYTYSGGLGGWIYTYTIDSVKKQLLFNNDGVITEYTLTEDQISELQAAIAAVTNVPLPHDTAPCCCDRFQYSIELTFITRITSQWSDCTTDVPAELNNLTTLIRNLPNSQS